MMRCGCPAVTEAPHGRPHRPRSVSETCQASGADRCDRSPLCNTPPSRPPTLTGAVGSPVSVEVHVSNGLPGFTIVGLPDAAVRESRDRVRAALLSSGLPWPLRRTVVNLAPSGVRKGGAGLDLPIAVGLLVAAGELSPECTDGLSFCGELGLNGSLRHVPGMIALADAAGAARRGRPTLRRPRGSTGARGCGARRGHVGRARGHPAGPGGLARRASADSDRSAPRSHRT